MSREIMTVRTRKVIYREGDKTIKSFNEGYPKADILNEAVNHARVEETGLAIPKILGVQTIDNNWCIVLEYIEGETLGDLMKQNPDKVDEYLKRFVELQMEVHQQKAPLLNKLKDKLERKISEAAIDEVVKYDLLTKLKVMPKHAKVCHGDFHPSNIIVHPNGNWYILDWSHATQGNASADVANTYIELIRDGNIELANQYLHLYCSLSNTSLTYVQGWMGIVAAGLLEKADEKDKEFLLSFVNVVEY